MGNRVKQCLKIKIYDQQLTKMVPKGSRFVLNVQF